MIEKGKGSRQQPAAVSQEFLVYSRELAANSRKPGVFSI